MDDFIVIVDKISDWQPYYPTESLVTAKDYLFNKKYQEIKNLRIINLSKKYKYLSSGYYCSLLAEARNHRIIPNLKTINDLSKKRIYISDIDELQLVSEDMLKKYQNIKDNVVMIAFKVYFGQSKISEFKKLASDIYTYYPVPILEVRLVFDKVWKINSIIPSSLGELKEGDEDFFGKALEKYSNRIWRLPKEHKQYIYDIAVLHDPDEELSPSNPKALEKFKKSCESKSIYCEFITKKDLSRINEFDALFIRETTSISNHTYRFAKKAESEGLVVIDDADSMLKCTNKVFVAELMDRIGVANIPSSFVSSSTKETLDSLEKEFGYPMVVKIPDGSFSIGVKKAEDRQELISILEIMLKKSDLILIQKFVYTKFDWRIGVFDQKGLYACKYFMSNDHWQIYNHKKDQSDDEFSGDSQTLEISDVPKKVMNTAIKAANSIGKGLYGVDLKEDADGNVYVVEINDNPNIDDGIEDLILKTKLYDTIVDWFIKQIEAKKHPSQV